MNSRQLAAVKAIATAHRIARRLGFDVVRWPRPHDVEGALAAVLAREQINCVLDVGANIGEFGLQLRRLGYRARIVSFEPSPAALPRLQARAARDGSWAVRNVALGARTGAAQLHRHADSVFDSLHPALPAAHDRFAGLRNAGDTTVAVELLAVERRKATTGLAAPRIFLKLDTQGHDLDVLAGDPGLPDVVAVLVELSAQPIYADQPHLTRVVDRLVDEGFLPVAFQPVTRAADRLTVIEFDGLFVRP